MKWPRHYAFAYLAAKTPEEQRQAVKGCPAEWRDLVRSHIRTIKEKRGLAHKIEELACVYNESC